MSLYYEPDPANDDDPPLLPPILTPVVVPKNVDVFSKAIDFNLVQIETLGGFLTVSFDYLNGIYQNIWLKGNVELCYIGEFEC